MIYKGKTIIINQQDSLVMLSWTATKLAKEYKSLRLSIVLIIVLRKLRSMEMYLKPDLATQ